MTEPGEHRASDAERESVVEQLRDASVYGRLTLDELTDRTEAAYTATTHAELAMLTQDLPASGAAPMPPVHQGQPVRKRRWFVGIMGDSKRRGSWRIDRSAHRTGLRDTAARRFPAAWAMALVLLVVCQLADAFR